MLNVYFGEIKTEIKKENNETKTKCSLPLLSSSTVLWEILKWGSSPCCHPVECFHSQKKREKKKTLSCMSLMLQGAHGSLCFQGCLVQKAPSQPNSRLFTFPPQTRVLKHNHRQSPCNRPTSVRRIEIRQLLYFSSSTARIGNSAQPGVDYFLWESKKIPDLETAADAEKCVGPKTWRLHVKCERAVCACISCLSPDLLRNHKSALSLTVRGGENSAAAEEIIWKLNKEHSVRGICPATRRRVD